jgi:hypothetical protein
LIGRTATDNGANLMCALILAELLGDEVLASL